MSDLVKVKPLEWTVEARNGWRHGVCYAAPYHLMRRDDGWHYANGSGGVFRTVEEGQSAAQSDYTARILAALDLSAVEAMEAENKRLRALLDEAWDTTMDVSASLAAAISLLERGSKAARKAAPSDTMFDVMLNDYRTSLDKARAALAKIGDTND